MYGLFGEFTPLIAFLMVILTEVSIYEIFQLYKFAYRIHKKQLDTWELKYVN
jgi:hypothetical protein